MQDREKGRWRVKEEKNLKCMRETEKGRDKVEVGEEKYEEAEVEESKKKANHTIIFIRLFIIFALFIRLYFISNYIFCYYIICYYEEFFTSALADGLSLEFEWQQVSSSLLDSSQYPGHSQ